MTPSSHVTASEADALERGVACVEGSLDPAAVPASGPAAPLPHDVRAEWSLIRRACEGDDEARNCLLAKHIRLVYAIARRYHCRSLTHEDLVQEGVIGLLTAIERFNPAHGCRLSTYATHWIRQAIARAIEQNDRLIRLPVHVCGELRLLQQVREDLHQRLQREPDLEELAQESGLSSDRICQLRGATEPVSLETLVGEEMEMPLGQLAIDEQATDPEAGTLAGATLDQLRSILDHLQAREREVIELRYGLTGQKPLSLQEMSERLRITREGARQIEVRALARLRRALRASQWE